MSHQQSVVYPVDEHALDAKFTLGQSVTTTLAKMTLDTPSVNTCFTESSDEFTCTVAGIYFVKILQYSSAAVKGFCHFTVNGTIVRSTYSYANMQYFLEDAFLYRFEVGDVVKIQEQTATSTFNLTDPSAGLDPNTFFMKRIGA